MMPDVDKDFVKYIWISVFKNPVTLSDKYDPKL
jgi:hypothetical protein